MNNNENLKRIFQNMLKDYGENIIINGQVNAVGIFKENDDKFNGIDTKYLILDASVKQGDIIEGLGVKWLVITADIPTNNIYKKVVVRKLPYIINVSLDGVSNKQFDCFADSKTFNITTGTYFSSADGEIYVTLKNNVDTNSITLGQRFIKWGYPWKVTGIDKTKEGLVILTGKVDSFFANDDREHESTITIHDYSMAITNKVISINVNDTYSLVLDCEVDGAEDTAPIVTYNSSDNSIATIDSTGVITGIADGNVTISVTYHNITDTMNLAIKTVHSISITNETSNIKVGNAYNLTVDCKTNGIIDSSPTISYTSSNESVATIDSTGIITGISEGVTTVTVTYYDSVATMELSVQAIAYEISIANKVSSLNVGDALQLIITCTQDGVTDTAPTIIYSSSDESILSVDSNGLVTAISSGTAMITVSYNGTVDTMEVTVAEVANFTYDITSSNNLLIIKKTTTVTYTGHKYNNGVEDTTAVFDFSIDYGTLATSAITITATTDNYIKIKNNVDSGSFILRCNERGTSNYVEKTIQLKNIYGN